MGKQSRNRRSNAGTGIGLLFASQSTYLERIWEVTYKQAKAEGLSEEQAGKRADKALKAAKGQDDQA